MAVELPNWLQCETACSKVCVDLSIFCKRQFCAKQRCASNEIQGYFGRGDVNFLRFAKSGEL